MKSKRATNIADIGIIKRGKYIFFIIPAFETMLFAALESPEEKIFHSSKPEKTKIGQGMLSEGTLNPLLKNKVKTIISKNGWRIAHKIPREVCLYFTLMSRQVKKQNNSLNSHSSFNPRESLLTGFISYCIRQMYKVNIKFVKLFLQYS